MLTEIDLLRTNKYTYDNETGHLYRDLPGGFVIRFVKQDEKMVPYMDRVKSVGGQRQYHGAVCLGDMTPEQVEYLVGLHEANLTRSTLEGLTRGGS